MESEIENKDCEKKLKKDIVLISNKRKISLGVILYNALLHQANTSVRSWYKVIPIHWE